MCTVLVAPPMGFAVLLCLLVTSLTTSRSAVVSKEVAFECGPHGKFEYCIDEFPGCVVGCHCHPGYYFDTDTKICEPNMKLTQQFRRQYQPEPTPTATAYPTFRSYPTYTTYPTYPTPTVNDNLQEKRQFLTKDTDELGDWLYNQFFQTIESQIIRNKTDLSNNEKAPSRRSGGAPGVIKTKRKVRKHIRGRKKRKHGKDRGLRRKLLRITEDDSLFDDDDSDSDSGSDSSSSSSSDSGSTSDSSSEKDKSEEKKENKDTDHGDDHGHKKVIIFNRRPKPPLPSFIFLPSMDTPYYPPIGLPPPPLVPMYPMVPVPPMAPPMFPFPGPPKCDEENSKTTHTNDVTTTDTHQPSTSTPETETTTTSAPATTDVTTEASTESTSETTPSSTTEQPTDRRNSLRKHRRRPNLEKLLARAGGPGKQRQLTHKQQTKLMQKLRDKLKGKIRNDSSPTQKKTLEEFQDEDLNSDDVPNVNEDDAPSKQLHPQDNEEPHAPKLDVDFKYLSELIHRVNQSKSRNKPPLPFDLNEDLKQLQKLQSSLPTRRDMGSYIPTRQVNRQGTDDVYYSNLGRRIASMIRNADSEVEIQFTKNSEHANHQNQVHSILNENSFLPRSFWERSIRSPALLKIPSEYLDESRTLRHSNEKRLINLENEFQVYATSTPHPLSLQDLENILNTIKKAHAQLRQPTSTKQSNVSMNVNLLPKYAGPTRRHTRLFDPSRKVQYVTEHAQTPVPSIVYVEMHPAVVTNASVFHEPGRKYNKPYSDYWIFNPEPAEHGIRPRPVFDQTGEPEMPDNQIYNKKPMRQPFVGVLQHKRTENNRSQGEYLHFLKSRPLVEQTNPKKHPRKGSKYKNLNYFSGNKHYMFETDSYPLQQQPLLSPFNSQFSNAVRSEPSYFQNQYHRSEYFD